MGRRRLGWVRRGEVRGILLGTRRWIVGAPGGDGFGGEDSFRGEGSLGGEGEGEVGLVGLRGEAGAELVGGGEVGVCIVWWMLEVDWGGVEGVAGEERKKLFVEGGVACNKEKSCGRED